ncbi:hypothetical protein GCM10009715_31570 [Paeniglutamicibacter psychrophenolicus]|uniref:Amidohydrolase YtcJ n=1 Tax=Paeniglutamicibacter psychrophenolicus TaxID=257454 RepID=A0ABS4W967_9MICC|nr:amidohydrolase family protein [Paeniglutamicibacter psychrophenolicus]MBP2372747.1 putative amidohydrolase YtcJ [Paeniglutamicibacter psychrophenolicus]
MEPTIVYPARLVRTLDPANPTAQAVAVRGTRIRAVGSVAELMGYTGAVLDERYADAVLVPGFVEAHSHAGSGNVWTSTYVGLVDRIAPDGRRWPGCRSIEDVIARLSAAEAELGDPGAPLRAWGLDPIYFPGERFGAAELDRVSGTRPVHITHSSGHVVTINSAGLRACGIDAGTTVTGVSKDESGQPTGVLLEFAAMALAAPLVEGASLLSVNPEALAAFGQDGVNTGTTTLTDLGSRLLMEDAGVGFFRTHVGEEFPARLNVFHFGVGVGKVGLSLAEAAQRLVKLRALSTDKLRFGNVKLMLDGSIQGFTARLLEPGY